MWGPQRVLGAIVWTMLILLRWVHSQFIETPARWWVDTVATTSEESAKAAVRGTFAFVARFINGIAALAVAIFIDRSFWRRRAPRRKRSTAWQAFWAQNKRHSFFNDVIEREDLIKGSSASSGAAAGDDGGAAGTSTVTVTKDDQHQATGSRSSRGWMSSWSLRHRRATDDTDAATATATTNAHRRTRSAEPAFTAAQSVAMQNRNSDMFDRPSGFAVAERGAGRTGLLESTRISLEVGIEALFIWLRSVASKILFLGDKPKVAGGENTFASGGSGSGSGRSSRRADGTGTGAGIASGEGTSGVGTGTGGGGMRRNHSFGKWEDTSVWTASDVIIHAGYPLQEQVVTTSDGYILTMQRIPRADSRDVVFFQHGVLDTSLGWVSNGVAGSQAFAAWENGADVWLGSCRANPPRAHADPSKYGSRYWAYSINEMGMEDVAAQIDRIHQVKTIELASNERGAAVAAAAGVVGGAGDSSYGGGGGLQGGSAVRPGLHKRSGSDSALAAAHQMSVAADAMPHMDPPNEASIRQHNLELAAAAAAAEVAEVEQRSNSFIANLIPSSARRRRASADVPSSSSTSTKVAASEAAEAVPMRRRATSLLSLLRLGGSGGDVVEGTTTAADRLRSTTSLSVPAAMPVGVDDEIQAIEEEEEVDAGAAKSVSPKSFAILKDIESSVPSYALLDNEDTALNDDDAATVLGVSSPPLTSRLHRMSSLPVLRGRRAASSDSVRPLAHHHQQQIPRVSSFSVPRLEIPTIITTGGQTATAADASPSLVSSSPRSAVTITPQPSSRWATPRHEAAGSGVHDSAASSPRGGSQPGAFLPRGETPQLDQLEQQPSLDQVDRLMTPDRVAVGGQEHAPLPWSQSLNAKPVWDPLPSARSDATATAGGTAAVPSSSSTAHLNSSSTAGSSGSGGLNLDLNVQLIGTGDGEPYRLQAIGHSLGGASLLIYAVTCRILGRPHRLSKLVLLTPAGFHRRPPTIAKPFLPILPSLMWLLNKYRPGMGTPIYIPSSLLRYVTFKLTVDLHQIPALNELTRAALRLLLNGDASEWDRALQMPHYNVTSMPALSLHTGDHLLQLIATHRFLLYNYGSPEANKEHYGTPTPLDVAAHYHLLQGLPIDLVAGKSDGVVSVDDVTAHYEAMKAAGLEVTYKELDVGHLDVTFAINDEVQLYLLSRLGLQPAPPVHL